MIDTRFDRFLVVLRDALYMLIRWIDKELNIKTK